MPGVDRNVVRLHPVIRTKTSLSVVQRPRLSGAFKSSFPDSRGDGCTLTGSIYLQKRYRVRCAQKPARVLAREGLPALKHQSLPAEQIEPSEKKIIDLILGELETLRKPSGDDEFLHFAWKLKSMLLSSNGEKKLAVLESLRHAYFDNGLWGLNAQIKYLYHGTLANRQFSKSDLGDQTNLADLRYPIEWYPATRTIQRSIHLHVGPTNSGKTFHALKRLEKAKSGIYAGPLRLLAHEVYTRLNAKGIRCDLLTGDERTIMEDGPTSMISCTVEMVPINQDIDVAVVDEIQMIGDPHRGWAWTQALLGLKAKEVHLCGEARTVPLIRELAALMGDHLEVHHYQRLSPLETMSSSLNGDWKRLRKGDCVVSFSRVGIHALKKEIEGATGKQVAIVYGSLPPETRAQQARLFNDPDNEYDFLVASDAIGMGLNLSIKRIIFETTIKFNGVRWERVNDNHLKQIAGRAGRYRTASQTTENNVICGILSKKSLQQIHPTRNLGLVTSLDQRDLPNVIQAMQSKAGPVMTAGIFPPVNIITQFATYFPPDTPFSYILLRLHELALTGPRFHLCELRDQVRVADILEPVKNLTTNDRLIFCAAPINPRQEEMGLICKAFANCVANNRGGGLLEIAELNLDILDKKVTPNKQYLATLELLHKALVLYLWLSYRFTGVFTSQAMAFYVKGLVEENINKVLAAVSINTKARREMKIRREKAMMAHLQKIVKDARRKVPKDGLGVEDIRLRSEDARSEGPLAENADVSQLFWHPLHGKIPSEVTA